MALFISFTSLADESDVSDRIVGTWENSTEETWFFFVDNTYVIYNEREIIKGTWRVLEGRTVVLDGRYNNGRKHLDTVRVSYLTPNSITLNSRVKRIAVVLDRHKRKTS